MALTSRRPRQLTFPGVECHIRRSRKSKYEWFDDDSDVEEMIRMFEVEYTKNMTTILRMCRRVSREFAHDISQELYFRVPLIARKYNGSGTKRGYLLCQIYFYILKEFKALTQHREFEENSPIIEKITYQQEENDNDNEDE